MEVPQQGIHRPRWGYAQSGQTSRGDALQRPLWITTIQRTDG